MSALSLLGYHPLEFAYWLLTVTGAEYKGWRRGLAPARQEPLFPMVRTADRHLQKFQMHLDPAAGASVAHSSGSLVGCACGKVEIAFVGQRAPQRRIWAQQLRYKLLRRCMSQLARRLACCQPTRFEAFSYVVRC